MLMNCIEAEIARIEDASSLAELHKAVVATKVALGFRFYAFIQSNNGRSTGGLLLQDYPESWVQLQSETFGYVHSPILQLASQSATPFEWHDLPRLLELSAEQRRYLRLAADHGLALGYSIPIHAPGEASALVSFVNPEDAPVPRERLPLAMYVAARVFDVGSRLRRATEDTLPRLSNADARVITLVCRGHSKRCIAQKLGIEVEDVSRAVVRGCKHYRVGSQTEMIVHALYERSIRFEDIIR
jgi:LuxR family transcriptional regulator, quorum-sensing system regulator CciR